jgi:AhpD family alkylhydroperoxidase
MSCQTHQEHIMTRLNWIQASPADFQALLRFSTYVNEAGLDHRLLDLVKLRASQINGCAYCIDMHTKDARAAGETEQRLYLLNAWHEAAHLYSEREQAALALTEAVTRLTNGQVPDAAYDAARAQFQDAELVQLVLAITMINTWNRLNCTFRVEAGSYQPGMFKRLKQA